MKSKPKITWLERAGCGNRAIDKGDEFAIESEGKKLVVFKMDKLMEYDIVGIFKAENWEDCEEGYGGFFFGRKK